MAVYDLTPIKVPLIETKYRTIKTALPVPESIPLFDKMAACEAGSMMGQPPVIWDRAKDFTIYDKWGNRWIDWSSGVLITNIGHGNAAICAAIKEAVDKPLLTTYVFPHQKRIELSEKLQKLSPDPDNYKVFLLSTGSEATENCIKLAKTYALNAHGPEKKYILSFNSAFHGRTMGAQLAGGIAGQKRWMIDHDNTFIHVPFPDGFYQEDTSFDVLLETLKQKNITPQAIAGVITESFQGVGPNFFPLEYATQLEVFCSSHDIVLIMDEVQAGFGRSGKIFTYQHYDITPDLIACGKGVSSSLPLSAVIGRKEIMELYPPGAMTSTHSGSPVCVAATLANLNEFADGNYLENAVELGGILENHLAKIHAAYPDVCARVSSKGLVGGILIVKPGTKTPDPKTAVKISTACFHRGLLMFAPVGVAGECIKIAPPLSITKDAFLESLEVLDESIVQVIG
jgi:4-aminobutyrate aminotransferase/(S)-3-amino-2-methylpropionate transaminase